MEVQMQEKSKSDLVKSSTTLSVQDKVPLGSETIPEDLLFALTEISNTPKPAENLRPIKRLKTPKELRLALKKGPPDSVWHHKGRRIQFQHLTAYPRGDGKNFGTRDVSFLYDVAGEAKPRPQKPSIHDKSGTRLEAANEVLAARSSTSNLAVPDTVIPEEYHMVKTKAVLGLEHIDADLTSSVLDKEKTLRIFPSLKPTKRFEVLQLAKTMDIMLEQCGVDDVEIEAKGPTQIHNLIEIMKKEQRIYDTIFHEVIRQVTIECADRGQLLSKLRQRYADLLGRVPRQIESLHSEVMAQRSLDRRLTEELLRFKESIGHLTSELSTVKEHDKQITKEAERAQLDLAEALKESHANASMVDEYHELYELQRHRLEVQVMSLAEERELWSNAAYSLALKIINLNSLTTAKRLHVTEKAWSKLAGHLTALLGDKDTECMIQFQRHVDSWREQIFHFNQVLEADDKQTKKILTEVGDAMERWIKIFNALFIIADVITADQPLVLKQGQDLFIALYNGCWQEITKPLETQSLFPLVGACRDLSPECIRTRLESACIAHTVYALVTVNPDTGIRTVNIPSNDFLGKLCKDIKVWEEMISNNVERFGGDHLLSNHERLYNMEKEIEHWTDIALVIYNRHRSHDDDRYPQQNVMVELNGKISRLFRQFRTRIVGENGSATAMIALQNHFETWSGRITMALRGAEALSEMDWLRLFDHLQDFKGVTRHVIDIVASHQPSEVQHVRNDRIDVHDTMKEVQKWLKNSVNGIDGENGKLSAQVSKTHSDMIHWMVLMLLYLAPDKERPVAAEKSLAVNCTLDELTSRCRDITENISVLTNYLSKCVTSVVEAALQERRESGEVDADHEYRDFLRFKTECKEWIRTTELLLNTLHEEPVEILTPQILNRIELIVPKGGKLPKVTSVADKMDLEKPLDATQNLPKLRPANKETEAKSTADEKPASASSKDDDKTSKRPPSTKTEDQKPKDDKKPTQTSPYLSMKENIEAEKNKSVETNDVQEVTKTSEIKPIAQDSTQTPQVNKPTEKDDKEVKTDESVKKSESKIVESTIKSDEAVIKTDESTIKTVVSTIKSDDSATKTVDLSIETSDSTIKTADSTIKTDDSVSKPTVSEVKTAPSEASVQPEESISNVQVDVNANSMQIIGRDENVTVTTVLNDNLTDNEDPGQLSPPSSALTQSAYDAIANMDQLQSQLLETEKRAQNAESKVIDLQGELNSSNERLRALEKKLAELTKTPSPTPSQSPEEQSKSPTDETKTESKPDPVKRPPSRASPSGKRGKKKK